MKAKIGTEAIATEDLLESQLIFNATKHWKQ